MKQESVKRKKNPRDKGFYSIVKRPQKLTITEFFKLVIIAIIIIAIILLFVFDILELKLRFAQTKSVSHVVFSLLNGLIMGLFLSCLGFGSSLGKTYKYVLFTFIVLFIIFGIGLLALEISINLDFLVENTYQTNSEKGIYFFVGNIVFFSSLFFGSFLSETEIN